jgi:hypothetical protein
VSKSLRLGLSHLGRRAIEVQIRAQVQHKDPPSHSCELLPHCVSTSEETVFHPSPTSLPPTHSALLTHSTPHYSTLHLHTSLLSFLHLIPYGPHLLYSTYLPSLSVMLLPLPPPSWCACNALPPPPPLSPAPVDIHIRQWRPAHGVGGW